MAPNPHAGVILIVEEASIGRMVKRVLARAGHKAIETDVQQAMRLVARGDSSAKLVITNRPRPFAELNSAAPVLYLASAPDWELANGATRMRILRKPFQAKDLLQAVDELTAHAGTVGG
jgi:PHD/YefM family antitoxin component YafN of YafNO toxin-antitoxin module